MAWCEVTSVPAPETQTCSWGIMPRWAHRRWIDNEEINTSGSLLLVLWHSQLRENGCLISRKDSPSVFSLQQNRAEPLMFGCQLGRFKPSAKTACTHPMQLDFKFWGPGLMLETVANIVFHVLKEREASTKDLTKEDFFPIVQPVVQGPARSSPWPVFVQRVN